MNIIVLKYWAVCFAFRNDLYFCQPGYHLLDVILIISAPYLLFKHCLFTEALN